MTSYTTILIKAWPTVIIALESTSSMIQMHASATIAHGTNCASGCLATAEHGTKLHPVAKLRLHPAPIVHPVA